MADTSPRPRYGGSKVRTGCITCKTRRVKCDETKPNCSRCTKAGRVCEGYADPNEPQKSHRNTFIIINYVPTGSGGPCSLPVLGKNEQRSLTYFSSKAATEFSGVFSDHVWSQLIMQVAQHEVAIRHAIIALGALYESFGASTNMQAPQSELAMQQYGKAIQQVISIDITASNKFVDVAVIACLLFTAFESIQGHYQSALQHVNSGVKILAEYSLKGNKDLGSDRYIPGHVLRKLFVRLDSQALEIGDNSVRPPCEYLVGSALPSLPKTFSDIEKANVAFEFFTNRIEHLLQAADKLLDPDTPVEKLKEIGAQHAALVQYFQSWSTAFESAQFPPDSPSTLVLQANQTMMGILLKVNPVLGELVFDPLTSDFAEIVSRAERFIAVTQETSVSPSSFSSRSASPASSTHSGQNDLSASVVLTQPLQPPYSVPTEKAQLYSLPTENPKPTFTLSLGIITPLWVVCARCRNPTVRRRALQLLRICNRKEGIWDSVLSARVAERVIEIEEAGANIDVVAHAEQIPEEARVRELDTFFGAGRTGRIKYRKSRMGMLEGEGEPIMVEVGGSPFLEEAFEW